MVCLKEIYHITKKRKNHDAIENHLPLPIPLLPTCSVLPALCLCLPGLITWNSLSLLYKLSSLATPAHCLYSPDSLSQPEMSSSPSPLILKPSRHSTSRVRPSLTHSDHPSSELLCYPRRCSYRR